MSQSLLNISNHQIFLLTCHHDDRDFGMIATWVVPTTLAKGFKRLVVPLSKGNSSTNAILEANSFALHLLAKDQSDLVYHFGGQSSKDVNKFEAVSWERGPSRHPIVANTCGWLHCTLMHHIDLGDRHLIVADGSTGEVDENKEPLRKKEAFLNLTPEHRQALEKKYTEDAERDATRIKRFIP